MISFQASTDIESDGLSFLFDSDKLDCHFEERERGNSLVIATGNLHLRRNSLEFQTWFLFGGLLTDIKDGKMAPVKYEDQLSNEII